MINFVKAVTINKYGKGFHKVRFGEECPCKTASEAVRKIAQDARAKHETLGRIEFWYDQDESVWKKLG